MSRVSPFPVRPILKLPELTLAPAEEKGISFVSNPIPLRERKSTKPTFPVLISL